MILSETALNQQAPDSLRDHELEYISLAISCGLLQTAVAASLALLATTICC